MSFPTFKEVSEALATHRFFPPQGESEGSHVRFRCDMWPRIRLTAVCHGIPAPDAPVLRVRGFVEGSGGDSRPNSKRDTWRRGSVCHSVFEFPGAWISLRHKLGQWLDNTAKKHSLAADTASRFQQAQAQKETARLKETLDGLPQLGDLLRSRGRDGSVSLSAGGRVAVTFLFHTVAHAKDFIETLPSSH